MLDRHYGWAIEDSEPAVTSLANGIKWTRTDGLGKSDVSLARYLVLHSFPPILSQPG